MTYVSTKWRKDGRSNAKTLLSYISDADKTNGVVRAVNLSTLETAVAEMEGTIAMSRSTNKAIRHIIVSQPPGENPTPEQFDQIAKITMDAYGMDSRFHQYVYAVHYDTDHAHLHIMANHVNPVTLKAVNEEPMIEKLKSDIAERKIEQTFGFQPNPAGMIKAIPDASVEEGYRLVPDLDNAPYVRVYTHDDGTIDVSRGAQGFYVDKRELGRFMEERDSGMGRDEREMIYQRAERPFTDYLKTEVKTALDELFKNDDVSWSDVHRVMHELNVVFVEVDRGLRVYDIAERGVDPDDVTSNNEGVHKHYGKASDISYKYSKKKLESRCGPFEKPGAECTKQSQGE